MNREEKEMAFLLLDQNHWNAAPEKSTVSLTWQRYIAHMINCSQWGICWQFVCHEQSVTPLQSYCLVTPLRTSSGRSPMNESQATCAVDLTADPLVEPLVDAWASDLIDNLPVIDQRWQGGCVQFVVWVEVRQHSVSRFVLCCWFRL